MDDLEKNKNTDFEEKTLSRQMKTQNFEEIPLKEYEILLDSINKLKEFGLDEEVEVKSPKIKTLK